MTDRVELAMARSRAWGLLARLVLRGPNGVDLEEIAATGGLSEAWPADASPDELAAEHHAAFALEVFPHAGVFLDAEPMAGGARADAVTRAYREAGFTPVLDDVGADHLGVMLAFLGFVEAAAAEAREDGREAIARRIDRLAARFLDAHVLSWLPAMTAAFVDHGRRPWVAVVELALGLAIHRRWMLDHPVVSFELLGSAEVLADPRTDLRALGRVLAAPARCGAYLSRADLAAVGRDLELPAGFGSRAQTAGNLLYAAAQYEMIPQVARRIASIVERRRTYIAASGVASELAAPWIEAATATESWLARLAAGALERAVTEEAR